MKLSKTALSLLLAGGIVLAGCSAQEEEVKSSAEPETEEVETKAKDTEEVIEEPTEEPDNKQEYDEETGRGYVEGLGYVETVGVGYNEEIGIDGVGDNPLKPIKMGTMELEISSLAILEIEPEEDVKEYSFGGKDKVKAIVVSMKTENTSEEDVTFYPNQSIMVTDTGEQVEPDMMLMGDAGGDFLGKVKKEGQTWWLLEHDTDISEVTMIIGAPYSAEDWEDMGDEKRLEFEVLNWEEAMERDDR